MIEARVNVRPVGAAWMVDGAEGLQPLLILPGSKASAQAYTLGGTRRRHARKPTNHSSRP